MRLIGEQTKVPVKIRKLPGKNLYRVSTPNGVKARATTQANARKQKRLLENLDKRKRK